MNQKSGGFKIAQKERFLITFCIFVKGYYIHIIEGYCSKNVHTVVFFGCTYLISSQYEISAHGGIFRQNK